MSYNTSVNILEVKRVFVNEWLSDWVSLRSCALAARTVESYRDLIARYIAPALGGLDLAALGAADMQRLIASICAAGHVRTAQLVLVLIRAACRDAVMAGYLAADPTARVLRPRHVRADPRFMTADQMQIFAHWCIGAPWGHAWLLAMLCGLRRGELAGLRWSDVDLTAGVLHIRNQRQRIAGRGVIDCPPKSAAGRRDIPLPADLGRLLALVKRRQAAQGTVCGFSAVYVVSYTDNRPIDPHALNAALSRDLTAAALPPINLHGLRHSMATAAVSAGVSIKVLQSLLGHANYATTADIYAHVLPDDRKIAIDAVAAHVL